MKVRLDYNYLDDKQQQADDIIERVLSDGALQVQGDAMAYAPVDTGRLRASITLHRVGNLLWEVFTVVEYAKYQEYGTVHQSGKAFFRPSYERNYQQIIANLVRELKVL